MPQTPTMFGLGLKQSNRTFLKAFLLTFSLMVLCKMLFGQAPYLPMVEENKYWIYYDFTDRPRPTAGFLITMKGDTTVDGKVYKKVYQYPLKGTLEVNPVNEPLQFFATVPYELGPQKLISLIREDLTAKQVYNRPIPVSDPCEDNPATYENDCIDIAFCTSQEHLLFDFNLVEDDALNYCAYVPMGNPWNIPMRYIDSIRYETHFNKSRKTFYSFGIPSYLQNLQNPGPIPEGPVKILEGVGFLYQGIFHFRYGYLKAFCEGSWENCNIISNTFFSQQALQRITVSPNPAFDVITLESATELTRIELYNPQSWLIGVWKERQIDVSQLPSGIYGIKTTDQNGKIGFGRFVKL
jgi:hypothetical protein